MRKRLVIKIGSSSIIGGGKIKYDCLDSLASSINKLKKQYDCILVTSGAVALGSIITKIKPKTIKEKQALAAIGQAELIKVYEETFDQYEMKVAQILLSHDDFGNRKRIVHLENTIDTLLSMNVLPIINENDALAVDEIKVGDNDTLAALIASVIKSQILVLCSDIDGLYDKNPNIYDDAKLIPFIDDISSLNVDTEGKSDVGTGGMATKIKAAKIVTKAGCDMIIINSNKVGFIEDAINNKIGSYFKSNDSLSNFNHWLLYKSNIDGSIIIDDGAKDAILKNKSLLSSGIIDTKGDFLSSSIVEIINNNKRIAVGRVKYSSYEINRIKGLSQIEVKKLMGDKFKSTVIHTDELVLEE